MIKSKIKEWIKRYLPGEIIGTVTAIAAAGAAHSCCDSLIVVAYCGTLGEAVGFYSTILVQDSLAAHKKLKIEKREFSVNALLKIILKLVLEFGPAGIIDGLILRPFFMYLFPLLLKNFMLGIFIGKIAGDITFYILVIISYELNKKKKIK
jgi:hypothetical protein